MTTKRKIATASAVLAVLLIGLGLYAWYDFTHSLGRPFTDAQLNDIQFASKGALGEAIFNGAINRASVVPNPEGKTGVDALLAPDPTESKREGLINDYRRDPQKYKRYADMLDSGMTAAQLMDALQDNPVQHLPVTSVSLAVEPKLKLDAWGRPFCLIPLDRKQFAIISGGPSHIPCNSLPVTASQISLDRRKLYAGPQDVVIVVKRAQPKS